MFRKILTFKKALEPMRKWLSITLFLVIAGVTNGQNDLRECRYFLSLSDSIYSSRPDSSYQLSCLAEKCAVKNGYTLLLAKAQVNKGRYFLLKSMLQESDAELNKAYEIYNGNNDVSGLAYVLKLKSILYGRLNNKEESFKLLKQSCELYKKGKKYKEVYSSLLNLSMMYVKNDMLEDAGKVFEEMEQLESYKGRDDEYFYNQNKGLYESALKNYQAAENNFLKAWRFAKLRKMIDSEATILMLLGRNSRHRNDLKSAEKYLLESEQLSQKNELDHELLDAYTELVLLYQQSADYKQAFNYQMLKETLSGKLMNLEHVNKIASLEKKLAVSEKQKEVDLEKEKAVVAKGETRLLVFWLIGIALVLVLLVLLFVRTQKLKNKIHYKNLIIETKQKEMLDSIHYAKKIQKAHLPSEQYISKKLEELGKKNK